MDPNASAALPEDLTALSDDEIAGLRERVMTRAADLSDDDTLDDATVAELESLADALDLLNGEDERRGQAAADRASRAQAARARLTDADPEDGEDGEDGGGEPVEVEAESVDAEPVPVTAAAPKNLAARRPRVAAPNLKRSGAFMQATQHVPGMTEGSPLDDPKAVAEAICKKRMAFGHIPDGVSGEYISVATGTKSGIDHVVSGDAESNFSVFADVQANAQALVASGGCQPPITPLYEFFRLCEPQSPVEDVLPVVQAPRGGIRYIQSPATAAALTDAHDALDRSERTRDYTAGFSQFTAGPKSYAVVNCPSVVEAYVVAASQVVHFDNLAYRIFPEQVEAFMSDVAVSFASMKDVYYLDYIDTNSTAVSAAYAYGAGRNLLRDWTLTAVAYRKRHGMKRDARLQVLAPDWAMDEIRLDLALDAQPGGISQWEVSDAQVMSALRTRGLEVAWYNDAPSTLNTGVTNQKFNAAQAVGALNAWPTKVAAYIYAPGTFVRLDGGTLDVGLVRDSTLNRTNDLQLFSEEWIGVVKLGHESVRILSTVAPTGAAPAGVTAATS